MVQCPDCGLTLAITRLQAGQEAICPRCSALIQTTSWQWHEVFALWLAGVLLWDASLVQPLLAIEVNGQVQAVAWWQLAGILWQNSALFLSLMIALTTIVAPMMYFILLAWALFAHLFPVSPWWTQLFWQWLRWSRSGLMLEVFFLGLLVSAVKLSDVARVIPTWSLGALVGLMLVVSALSLIFVPVPNAMTSSRLQTEEAVKSPDLSLIWALWASACILYVPANLLPMMTVSTFGHRSSDTIIDGVVHFLHAGQWHLALVIFVASIVVPLSKLLVLTGLLLSVQFKWCRQLTLKTKVYRWIRWVGVWSMVDVFVITLLVALVQFGEFAQVQAGSGALAFLLVILFTLSATHLFQSRWLWARCQH